MNGWNYYGTKELQVVPYMPGTPVYKDGVLPALYYRAKEEGKIESVFCGDVLNLDAFVNFFQTRKTMQILCEVKENKDLIPAGFSWVDNPRGVDGARACMCGFCFFGKATQSIRDLGRLGIAYWMIDMKINVLHGIILESNIPAKNYAQRLGFQEVAVVPLYHYHQGALEGARVMLLKDTEFIPEFEEWFAKQNHVESTS